MAGPLVLRVGESGTDPSGVRIEVRGFGHILEKDPPFRVSVTVSLANYSNVEVHIEATGSTVAQVRRAMSRPNEVSGLERMFDLRNTVSRVVVTCADGIVVFELPTPRPFIAIPDPDRRDGERR